MLLANQNVLWYLLPLALAVSLVYSASRFEMPDRIMHRAVRLFFQIMLFMGTVFAILFVLSDGL
jgi:heme/copper-type cytochrome/quinol oxidase subunit 2